MLATSGALAGIGKSLRLLPCELAGYLIAILVWHQALRPLIALHPSGPVLSKLLACAYLIYLVTQLYKPSPALYEAAPPVSPFRIFVVTLTNPKAVVFALLVFDQTRLSAPEFAVFAALLPCIAALWIGLGRTVVATGPIRNPLAI